MIIDGIPTAMTEVQVDAFDSLIDYFRVATFIELGTSKGGLAFHFLEKQNQEEKARYYDPDFRYFGFELYPNVIEDRMRKYIIIADVSSQETINKIKGLVDSSDGSVIIFCDTNDKPREMLAYAKLLRVLDILIGHDYPGEITDKFLDEFGVDNPNLQEIGGPSFRSQGYSAWIKIK